MPDVEQLVSLILDQHIQGHIDKVNKLLEHGDRSSCCYILDSRQCIVSSLTSCECFIQVEGNEEVYRDRQTEYSTPVPVPNHKQEEFLNAETLLPMLSGISGFLSSPNVDSRQDFHI